jgi:nucleoside-diphosphate-sugar epimerase
LPDDKIAGKTFNAGYENHKVAEIAEMVRATIGPQVNIITTSTDDNRSYHISSEKIKKEIGFVPTHTITDAIQDLKNAFEENKIPNSLTDDLYFNVKQMQKIKLA